LFSTTPQSTKLSSQMLSRPSLTYVSPEILPCKAGASRPGFGFQNSEPGPGIRAYGGFGPAWLGLLGAWTGRPDDLGQADQD
jgi:hypothetical protein